MRPRHPWPLLRRVRQFSIAVEPRAAAGPRVPHTGIGRLRVEHTTSPATSTLIWREHGRWTSGPLAGLAFRNATAWSRVIGQTGLELSHLRRGDGTPTFLVHLEPGPSGAWVTREPHTCGADLYSAVLEWDAQTLHLSWEVESPSEPYRLRIEARVPEPAPS
jgi:Family of unknown function (DUF6314)